MGAIALDGLTGALTMHAVAVECAAAATIGGSGCGEIYGGLCKRWGLVVSDRPRARKW